MKTCGQFKRSEGNERLSGEFYGAKSKLKVSDLTAGGAA